MKGSPATPRCVASVNAAAYRGFVWEPDRNPKEDKDFVTFIAQVEGLSAVPDGRIYMNAFIDTIKGGKLVAFLVRELISAKCL